MVKTVSISILMLVCLNLSGQEGSTATMPNVLIVTTGGTIASVEGAPMVQGSQLVGAVPALAQLADITVHEFSRIGSSQMTPQHWLNLLNFLHDYVDNHPSITGIVITHGTDTMEETAFFLHLTYKRSVPVVMVGSMRTSSEVSPDGPANLINAVRTCIHPSAKGKGVLVVLNENISSARDLQKMHNRRVDSFRPGEFGYLGSIDPDGVRFYRASSRPHTEVTEFNLESTDTLPRVELVTDFTDFNPDILEYFLSRPIDGLVIATFAGGRLSRGMRDGLLKSELPFPVVVSSSIPEGRIIGNPAAGIDGTIISHHFTPKKARILLMLALLNKTGPMEIQSLFEKH